MKVLFRQTIDLYGTRYNVGLRDIPEGHACGADWDIYVKAGWVVVQDKPKAVEAVEVEAAPVAEVAVEVAEDVVADDPESTEAAPVAEVDKPARSKKK